jgi:hypothetical protein
MVDFAKGVRVREKFFDNGGNIINIDLNIEELMQNPINNDKYINLTLKRGKESEKWYAINNDYYQKNKEDKQTITTEEIPF